MTMYINGEWVDRAETTPVRNPFDNSVIDTVPRGTAADVDRILTGKRRLITCPNLWGRLTRMGSGYSGGPGCVLRFRFPVSILSSSTRKLPLAVCRSGKIIPKIIPRKERHENVHQR